MYNSELYHHGIKGQKWGVRRFQNKDGTLTPKGEKRYKADSYDNMTDASKLKYHKDRFNDKVNDYVSSASRGKNIAKTLLLGNLGTSAYAALRVSGNNETAATTKAFLSSFLPVIGPILLRECTAHKYAENKMNRHK